MTDQQKYFKKITDKIMNDYIKGKKPFDNEDEIKNICSLLNCTSDIFSKVSLFIIIMNSNENMEIINEGIECLIRDLHTKIHLDKLNFMNI